MNENELYHHGIKGMKWGVRRYQNKNGTLTPEGKRYIQKYKDKKKRTVVKRMDKRIRSADKKLEKHLGKYLSDKQDARRSMAATNKAVANRIKKDVYLEGLNNVSLSDIRKEKKNKIIGASMVLGSAALAPITQLPHLAIPAGMGAMNYKYADTNLDRGAKRIGNNGDKYELKAQREVSKNVNNYSEKFTRENIKKTKVKKKRAIR